MDLGRSHIGFRSGLCELTCASLGPLTRQKEIKQAHLSSEARAGLFRATDAFERLVIARGVRHAVAKQLSTAFLDVKVLRHGGQGRKAQSRNFLSQGEMLTIFAGLLKLHTRETNA